MITPMVIRNNCSNIHFFVGVKNKPDTYSSYQSLPFLLVLKKRSLILPGHLFVVTRYKEITT
eukprot:UN26889